MERSGDWMDQAIGDLEHAQSDMERGYFDWCCFSAQQAAEKPVKAVFQKRGVEAWGHSVAELMAEVDKSEKCRRNCTKMPWNLIRPIFPLVILTPIPEALPGNFTPKRKRKG